MKLIHTIDAPSTTAQTTLSESELRYTGLPCFCTTINVLGLPM
jgi:hypothetical protein